MVGPQTREALNKRARSAAVVMKRTADTLRKALNDQQLPEPTEPRLKYVTNVRIPETVNLPGAEVNNMIITLHHWAAEIDRFTWSDKK